MTNNYDIILFCLAIINHFWLVSYLSELKLTDLHCHILCGIDDGASTITESKELLQQSLFTGVEQIVFTPHFNPNMNSEHVFLSNRSDALKAVDPLCKAMGILFRAGCEIAFTPFLPDCSLECLAFQDTPYILVELPTLYEPPNVEGVIEQIVAKGYRPILAHIERYSYAMEQPERLFRWICSGALAQINAEWVLSGHRAISTAKRLFECGLVHVMASDTHSLKRRPPNLDQGLKALPAEISEALMMNAHLIFEGKSLRAQTPICPNKRRIGRKYI